MPSQSLPGLGPTARDLIVALRAPFFLDLALSAQSYALRIHLNLFLIIRY